MSFAYILQFLQRFQDLPAVRFHVLGVHTVQIRLGEICVRLEVALSI